MVKMIIPKITNLSENSVDKNNSLGVTLSKVKPAGLVSGSKGAVLIDLIFSGKGVISSILLTHGPTSDKSTLSNVSLYDGMSKISSGHLFNESGILAIKDLNLTVDGSKNITVKADVSSDATVAQTIGMSSFVTDGVSVETTSMSGYLLIKKQNILLQRKLPAAVAVIVIVVALYSYVNKKPEIVIQNTKSPTLATSTIPRKEFGQSVPDGFPANIPLMKEPIFFQSYMLDYKDQKQLSVVFASPKSVKENYLFYQDFLKQDRWNVSNQLDTVRLGSLYGSKEKNDINITISESKTSTMKSQISISVLKK